MAQRHLANLRSIIASEVNAPSSKMNLVRPRGGALFTRLHITFGIAFSLISVKHFQHDISKTRLDLAQHCKLYYEDLDKLKAYRLGTFCLNYFHFVNPFDIVSKNCGESHAAFIFSQATARPRRREAQDGPTPSRKPQKR